MAFPGDLEQKGFEYMTVSQKFCPFLCSIDYYAVSHHGSINGHPSLEYKSKRFPWPRLHCICRRLDKVILMGKDGAFSGIYDSGVVGFWDSNKHLIYSEKDSAGAPVKFIELKWGSGCVNYYK